MSHPDALVRIEAVVLRALDELSPARFRELVLAEYRVCGLLDERGRWATERLAGARGELLPPALDEDGTARRLVGQMVRHAAANDYLMRFLRTATPESAPRVMAKFAARKRALVPVTVAYAFALQQLTALARRDYDVIDDLVATLRARRSGLRLSEYLTPFAILKLHSLEPVMAHMATDIRERRPSDAGRRVALTLNILEAAVTDVLGGRWANARAGWVLGVPRREARIPGVDGSRSAARHGRRSGTWIAIGTTARSSMPGGGPIGSPPRTIGSSCDGRAASARPPRSRGRGSSLLSRSDQDDLARLRRVSARINPPAMSRISRGIQTISACPWSAHPGARRR